jgi:hypothetical protein
MATLLGFKFFANSIIGGFDNPLPFPIDFEVKSAAIKLN